MMMHARIFIGSFIPGNGRPALRLCKRRGVLLNFLNNIGRASSGYGSRWGWIPFHGALEFNSNRMTPCIGASRRQWKAKVTAKSSVVVCELIDEHAQLWTDSSVKARSGRLFKDMVGGQVRHYKWRHTLLSRTGLRVSWCLVELDMLEGRYWH